MSSSRQVAITGCGAVCGSGLSPESIWEAVCQGRSAIKEIRSWDAHRWPVRLAGEVTDVDNRTLVEDRKLHKSVLRTDLFGLYAAGAAIQRSGISAYRETLPDDAVPLFNDRSGVLAGSGGGNYKNQYEFFPLLTEAADDMERFGRELGRTVNPMWLLRILPNNVVCHVGIRHGFKGTNACITNQSVGGLMAVMEAAAAIVTSEADRAIAVGHDTPVEPETLFHYHRLGLISADTVRPFDQARSGTLFGEGAAAVMLESMDDAKARGATILGEVLGSGCTGEAGGVVELRADGDGLSRAIQNALQAAGISPDDVGMVVAHGNGVPNSDASEVRALRRVFGDRLPPVTAFKWSVGHLLAAAGMLDLVLALNALRDGLVPGIATLNSLDPELVPFPASPFPQQPRSGIALILCRGFGGMSVALLIRGFPCASSR
ncbi:MAG TPA: beta-ketoacyl-[acyl-carrier-protein] synthase family protein [Verrucomicrobiae bacterium]|nr:beta-ketoacyl-[acyl-carrier-protein] synthase family protein [Verrucomicrobiae bacterium]